MCALALVLVRKLDLLRRALVLYREVEELLALPELEQEPRLRAVLYQN